MDSKPFPISLENVVFTRSMVISVKGYVESDSSALTGPVNEITVAQNDQDKNLYMATMTAKMNRDGSTVYPYIIDMECFGLFRVDDDADDEVRSRGILIVAHGVLYGAIREAIAWLTGRQAHGQISLGLSVLKPKQNPEPPTK